MDDARIRPCRHKGRRAVLEASATESATGRRRAVGRPSPAGSACLLGQSGTSPIHPSIHPSDSIPRPITPSTFVARSEDPSTFLALSTLPPVLQFLSPLRGPLADQRLGQRLRKEDYRAGFFQRYLETPGPRRGDRVVVVSRLSMPAAGSAPKRLGVRRELCRFHKTHRAASSLATLADISADCVRREIG